MPCTENSPSPLHSVERQQTLLVPSSIDIHGMVLVYYFQSIVHFTLLRSYHCSLQSFAGGSGLVFSLLDQEV